MKRNNDKVKKYFIDYILANYEKINVESGKCRYNFKCHFNAVHEAKKNGHEKIAMCMYIDEGYPIIHFVNYFEGKYVDNTLGQWTKLNDYYFVKWISDDQMWAVDEIFGAFRKDLRRRLSWWLKITSDYEC